MLKNEKEKILQYLVNNNIGVGLNISGETRLRNELGIDSLKLVQVMVDLEEIFNITIDESKLDPSNLETLDDLCKIVHDTISNGEEK